MTAPALRWFGNGRSVSVDLGGGAGATQAQQFDPMPGNRRTAGYPVKDTAGATTKDCCDSCGGQAVRSIEEAGVA